MFYGITEYSYCNLVFICVLNTVVRQDTILFIIKNLEDIFYETELIICIYKMPHMVISIRTIVHLEIYFILVICSCSLKAKYFMGNFI